jgi:hypothetical protein
MDTPVGSPRAGGPPTLASLTGVRGVVVVQGAVHVWAQGVGCARIVEYTHPLSAGGQSSAKGEIRAASRASQKPQEEGHRLLTCLMWL